MGSVVTVLEPAATTSSGVGSTFWYFASEATNAPHEVAEMALAHTIANKAEAAYRRGDVFDKRKELMTAWGNYCARKTGNVIPIREG